MIILRHILGSMLTNNMPLEILDLGLIEYEQTWRLWNQYATYDGLVNLDKLKASN